MRIEKTERKLYSFNELSDESKEKAVELVYDLNIDCVCEDYRMMLQQECEYQISQEVIVEIIEANAFEFTEDGKPA